MIQLHNIHSAVLTDNIVLQYKTSRESNILLTSVKKKVHSLILICFQPIVTCAESTSFKYDRVTEMAH